MRSTCASPALKWEDRFAVGGALAGLAGRAQPEECSLLEFSPPRDAVRSTRLTTDKTPPGRLWHHEPPLRWAVLRPECVCD